MNSRYSFLISPSEDNECWYLSQLPRPFEMVLHDIHNAMWGKGGLIKKTKSTYQLFTLDEGKVEPASEIIFWLNLPSKWYGQFLYSGAKVELTLKDRLPIDEDHSNQTLDLTIYESMFDDPSTDILLSEEEAELWSIARREKKSKTRDLSFYNNHNFLTPKNKKLNIQ